MLLVPGIFVLFVFVVFIEVLIARSGEAEEYKNPDRNARIFGQGNKLVYAVVGDSTTSGVGGDYEKGIAVTTAKNLAQNREVHMTNFSISGAVFKEVLDEQLPKALELNPEIILIAAGSNDVTHLTSLNRLESHVEELISQVRGKNRNTKIIFTGAGDLGSVPRFLEPLRSIASIQTNRVNRVFEQAEKNDSNVGFARIAEKTGPEFRKDRSLFYKDDFHPNDKGYDLWARVISEKMKE